MTLEARYHGWFRRLESPMRLDVIDNSGASSLIDELSKELGACRSARFATASLTRGGIRFIEDALRKGRNSLHIQLLVGLYNGHTEAAALRKLLRLQKHSGGQIEVRIARNRRFHWKLYLFESKGRATAFVGSSNLTNDGLGVKGELNLRLTGAGLGGALAHIAETFDREWKKDSFPLDVGIAERFAPASEQSKDVSSQVDPIIKALLRNPARNPARKEPFRETRVITSVEGFVGKTTIKAVKDKTDWYRQGWEWLVCTLRADQYRLTRAGAFYLAAFRGEILQLSLNDVRGDDYFRTEDGQYLVAYQTRKGSVTRNVGPAVLARLKRAGVINKKEDLRHDRSLSRAKCEALNSLLRVPVKQNHPR